MMIATEDTKRRIIERYLAGDTVKEAVRGSGYSYRTLVDWLKKAGIQARRRTDYRRYDLDSRYFLTIDTEIKAYWLGFIAADGNVSGTALVVGLAAKDEVHLYKLKSALSASHPVYRQQSKCETGTFGAAVLRISSTDLVADLDGHGIHSNKTWTVRPPVTLPHHLMPAYWRGVFDGDGHVCVSGVYKTGNRKWNIGLVGNEAMVQGFAAFVSKQVPSRTTVRRHQKSDTFYVRYSGTQTPFAVANLLYQDAPVYLERKYATYVQMKAGAG